MAEDFKWADGEIVASYSDLQWSDGEAGKYYYESGEAPAGVSIVVLTATRGMNAGFMNMNGGLS
jgi:hypothetical protein